MPQLDKLTYFSQFFWLCLLLFTFYILLFNNNNGILGISRILKLRNQLLSHRGNKIQSKDPQNLEDISRKGFSTGLSYMYSSLSEVSRLATKVWVFYMLSAPMQFLLHFFIISGLFLFFGENAQAAGEHMQPINPAQASVPRPENTSSMDALLDCLSLSESGDSSEPSVNQPAPDFLAVEQEQEARRARLDEIRQLLLEQYRIVEWKKRFWMQNSPYPDLSDGVVEGILRDLELFSYTSQELAQFISDFHDNPKVCNSLFRFLYKKP